MAPSAWMVRLEELAQAHGLGDVAFGCSREEEPSCWLRVPFPHGGGVFVVAPDFELGLALLEERLCDSRLRISL